jgi:hypothetical protein
MTILSHTKVLMGSVQMARSLASSTNLPAFPPEGTVTHWHLIAGKLAAPTLLIVIWANDARAPSRRTPDGVGDFYLRQAGDAERALQCFEKSLKTGKRTLDPTWDMRARSI